MIILDGFLENPAEYRAKALRLDFRTYDFTHCVFHGIAVAGTTELPAKIQRLFPRLVPSLSFFRRSPLGQEEPHFIHTDIDMGDWSAILYLNPDPPSGDGTNFWTHRETAAIGSEIPHERSIEGRDESKWILRKHVAARFNRLLIFPSICFHSRAIFENWGAAEHARLTQVVFGTGVL